MDVQRILEKQLGRLGLNCYDVCSGTGDGGGENEGQHGVHAYFENLSPGYVRRRCLSHIAWRTCDVAIRVSSLSYKTLVSYLTDGITWFRLRQLAITPRGLGGLGLFGDGTRACKAMFGEAPHGIVENRPETDLMFLQFLENKEPVLEKLASKDLESRDLNAETKAAVLNLSNIKDRVNRRILQEILQRCMYLHYWSGKHTLVASSDSWEGLLQRSVSLILSLDISDQVLERFRLTEDDLAAMLERPKTWVDLAVLQVVGDQGLVAERLEEALVFHRTVTDQAAAHLNLLCENTLRTPWLAARILSKDRAHARDAAAALAKHLAKTRPANRTLFEEFMFSSEDLRTSLEQFSREEPAVLLWHADGKYETLFKFLAPRFLLAPDSVLDAERVHARWQWLCDRRRALKLPLMNASLRLRHYTESNQAFPTDDELLPHLQAEAMQHKLDLASVSDDVAPGWRSSCCTAEQIARPPRCKARPGPDTRPPACPGPHPPPPTASQPASRPASQPASQPAKAPSQFLARLTERSSKRSPPKKPV